MNKTSHTLNKFRSIRKEVRVDEIRGYSLLPSCAAAWKAWVKDRDSRKRLNKYDQLNTRSGPSSRTGPEINIRLRVAWFHYLTPSCTSVDTFYYFRLAALTTAACVTSLLCADNQTTINEERAQEWYLASISSVSPKSVMIRRFLIDCRI